MTEHSRTNEGTEDEDRLIELGKLTSNLLSLEFFLRIALYESRTAHANLMRHEPAIFDLAVGDIVPQNAFTDFASLRELIRDYNAEIGHQQNSPIDIGVVDLRDAMAHGRVFAPAGGPVFTLLKFTKPSRKGEVRVAFAEKLTTSWLRGQRLRVAREIRKIHIPGRQHADDESMRPR